MTDQNNPPAPVAGDTGADAGPVATVFLKDNGQYGIMWLRPVPFVDGKAALFSYGSVALPDGWTDGLWRYGFNGEAFGFIDGGPYVLIDQVEKSLSAAVQKRTDEAREAALYRFLRDGVGEHWERALTALSGARPTNEVGAEIVAALIATQEAPQ